MSVRKRSVPRRFEDGADSTPQPQHWQATTPQQQHPQQHEGGGASAVVLDSPEASSMLLDLAAALQGQTTRRASVLDSTTSTVPNAALYAPPTAPVLPRYAHPLPSAPSPHTANSSALYSSTLPLHAPPQVRHTAASATTKVATLFSAPPSSAVTVAGSQQLQQQHAAAFATPYLQQQQAQLQFQQQMHQTHMRTLLVDGGQGQAQKGGPPLHLQQQPQPPPQQLPSPHDSLAAVKSNGGASGVSKHGHGSGLTQAAGSFALPPTQPTSPPAAAPVSVPVVAVKTSARRQSKAANTPPAAAAAAAAAAAIASSAHSDRHERAERSDRSDRSGGGSGGVSAGAQPDKHRRRLQRKAELARASRRRKKTYVNDLESKCAALVAQSNFLLTQVNKRPDLLAHIDQKLPPGLAWQAGLLKSSIDLKSKSAMTDDMSDGELEEDSMGDSDNEQTSDPAPPPPPPPAASKRHKAAAASHAAPDLTVLAHATDSSNPHAAMHAPNMQARGPSALLSPLPIHPSHSIQLQPHSQHQLMAQAHYNHMMPQQPHSSLQSLPMHSFRSGPSVASVMDSQTTTNHGGMHFHPRQSSDQLSLTPSAAPSSVAPISPPTAASTLTPAVHVIKAQYKGEPRRFSMPASDFTYARLLLALEQMLLPAAASASASAAASPVPLLLIKYMDDEGDEIEIHSTPELLEALRSQTGKDGLQSPAAAGANGNNAEAPILKLLISDSNYHGRSNTAAPSALDASTAVSASAATAAVSAAASAAVCSKRKNAAAVFAEIQACVLEEQKLEPTSALNRAGGSGHQGATIKTEEETRDVEGGASKRAKTEANQSHNGEHKANNATQDSSTSA